MPVCITRYQNHWKNLVKEHRTNPFKQLKSKISKFLLLSHPSGGTEAVSNIIFTDIDQERVESLSALKTAFV